MHKTKLFKILLALPKNSHEGLSLIELLVAVIIGGIALTAAASGFINLLTANQEVESKTNRTASLTRALAYMQNDIKAANSVTQEPRGVANNCSSTAVTSNECLVLTFPDFYAQELNLNCSKTPGSPAKVYYGFDDISTGSQIWLKPGVLKRKVICENNTSTIVSTNWTVIADGLISANETQPTTSCTQDGAANWAGGSTVYGQDSSGKGGFRFCLETTNNRLVRIFLYGHVIGGNSDHQLMVNTISFARAN